MTTKYEKSVNHIRDVQVLISECAINLQYRLLAHDQSKLVEPERSAYEGLDEKLVGITFGSDAYRSIIKEHLGQALDHHYALNRHHPEHYKIGITGMSLFDLMEMLCDLRAACSEKGKARIDLETNKRIHGISDDLYQILLNTIEELGWGRNV